MKFRTIQARQGEAKNKREQFWNGTHVIIMIPDIKSNIDLKAFGDEIEKYCNKQVILDIKYSNTGFLLVILSDPMITEDAENRILKIWPTYSFMDSTPWYKAVLNSPGTIGLQKNEKIQHSSFQIDALPFKSYIKWLGQRIER